MSSKNIIVATVSLVPWILNNYIVPVKNFLLKSHVHPA